MAAAAIVLLFLAQLLCDGNGQQVAFKEVCEREVKPWSLRKVLAPAPLSKVDLSKVELYLYDRRYRYTPLPLFNERQMQNINRKLPTLVLIHDWYENRTSDWVLKAKDVYLDREDVNVIVADHSGVSSTYYRNAIRAAPRIGKQIAALLKRPVLVEHVDTENVNKIQSIVTISRRLPKRKLHVIGSGLGAHIAGYVGRQLRKVGRVTGLNPSMFITRPVYGLSRTDARFVDVIHTDSSFYGRGKERGTVDYFVNRELRHQPQCNLYNKPSMLFDAYKHCERAYEMLMCSHRRSRDYWIESIRRNMFISTRGHLMGHHGSRRAFGADDVYTSCSAPYSVGLHARPPYC